MAALTYTLAKLRAVNRMLRAINALPVTALDSTGTFPSATYGMSQAARAEEILDDTMVTVLSRGWEENTARGVTLSESGNAIAVPVTTLRIIPAGKDQHRSLGIVASTSTLYDLNADTATFATGSTVCVDRIFWKAFADCTPALQDAITNEACEVFQRRYRGNPEQDAWLGIERLKTDSLLRKPTGTAAINTTPEIPPMNMATKPQ